jgi:hypothetical protein
MFSRLKAERLDQLGLHSGGDGRVGNLADDFVGKPVGQNVPGLLRANPTAGQVKQLGVFQLAYCGTMGALDIVGFDG